MLEAAIAEFRRCGYDGASMDAIAASAGVSKRTLYNHFASKEALFRSLADELVGRVSQHSRLDYGADKPLRDQLLHYARESAALIRDPEMLELVRALLSESLRSSDLVGDAMSEYWRDEYGFVAWVEAACRDGRLHAASPERAAHQFAALIKGIAVWPIVFRRDPPSAREIDAGIEEAVDMFLSYHAA